MGAVRQDLCAPVGLLTGRGDRAMGCPQLSSTRLRVISVGGTWWECVASLTLLSNFTILSRGLVNIGKWKVFWGLMWPKHPWSFSWCNCLSLWIFIIYSHKKRWYSMKHVPPACHHRNWTFLHLECYLYQHIPGRKRWLFFFLLFLVHCDCLKLIMRTHFKIKN